MGDAFKKVQAGQRIAISAEAYNAFIDAAQAVREHKQFGTEASQFFRQSGIVSQKKGTFYFSPFPFFGRPRGRRLLSRPRVAAVRSVLKRGLTPGKTAAMILLHERGVGRRILRAAP